MHCCEFPHPRGPVCPGVLAVTPPSVGGLMGVWGDGRWVCSAVLTTACLSCRSPAAGAAVLHRPWRTGHGFPGPAQLAPGRRGLPSASVLLQHAPTPIRTGGEGQVAVPGSPPGGAAGRTEACPVCLLAPSECTSRMLLGAPEGDLLVGIFEASTAPSPLFRG